MKIVKLLTDSGSQFTDRFTSKSVSQPDATTLMSAVGSWALSTACVRRATHRQTAWLSASMAESVRW